MDGTHSYERFAFYDQNDWFFHNLPVFWLGIGAKEAGNHISPAR
jgi:hypothetical protein